METKEKRSFKTEFRVLRDGNKPKITGYAAVFNRDSADMGFIERIAPGAFKSALKTSDVRALWNHNPDIVLGRTKSGTLHLKEDSNGLRMEVSPPDTQLVRDMVLSPIERGDVSQQSFGFTVAKDEWKNLETDNPLRMITEVGELFDVSPCTFPAYQDTAVALRSLTTAKGNTMSYKERIKKLMKEVGEMRDYCESQKRDPNKEERDLANAKLAEIDRLQKLDREFPEMDIHTERTSRPLDIPDDFPRVVERTPVDTRKDRKMNNSEFRNFGELLADVAVAGKNGIISGRLQRAATGLSESVPSDGGFLVSPTYSNNLLQTAWEETQVANRCWKVNIGSGSNSLKIPGFDETSRATGSRFGGVQGFWLAEAAEKTASKPKFRQIELNLNKLVGLCYASDEVIQDAGLLEQAIKRAFVSEIAFQLDNAVINGSGAGQPLGILNAGCTVSVSKEAGQSADTIVFENVLKMWSRLLPRSQRQAVWLVNQNAMPQIYQMSLAIGTAGAPVFLAAAGQASSSPYSTLFGRPIIPIEQCPTLGDSGDIILTDLKSGYILAQKAGGIQQDVSIHLRFVYDESCYRFVLRVDGQPTLASTITPFAGTDTLSHHVVLNERA